MKYYYLVISTKNDDAKFDAFVVKMPQCNNLKNLLKIKDLDFALICSTKKEADKICENWVDSFKKNKTYLLS